MEDTRFDAYFARHRRDAVLLHRPYPPQCAPRTNSKFGGLPRLPDHYEWPRDGNGVPLHFLAQIDCADIAFETALPERGVLFFFAREEEEQIWNDDRVNKDAARVIYALDAFAMTPLRAHPDDLEPVGGGDYPPRAWRELLPPGEQGSAVHVEWPIQPLAIETWPDALFEEPAEQGNGWLTRLSAMLQPKAPPIDWQAYDARQKSYAERLEALRGQAHWKATGQARDAGERPIFHDHHMAQAIFEYADKGPLAYPQHWVQVEYAVRAFINDFRDGRTHPILDEAQLPAARGWLEKAQQASAEQAVAVSDHAAFRDWLMTLEKPREDEPPNAAPYAQFVFTSLLSQIRFWAGDPARAASIPPHIYEAMRFYFVGETVWGLQYSQMMGHAPSTQEPLHPDDPMLCLLNLASDEGLGWMFGDVGNATFYISREDLARRDFSRVEAEVVGH